MNKTDKLIEIFKDQSLAEKLFAKETPEEVNTFLNENGLECSLDEVYKIGSYMASVLGNSGDGALSEIQLAEVTGGAEPNELPEGWMRMDDALVEFGEITAWMGAQAYFAAKDFFSKW